jgi:hypothetical protein
MPKICFVALYLETVSDLERGLRRFIIFTAYYTGLSLLGALFVQLFWCHPVSRNWYCDLQKALIKLLRSTSGLQSWKISAFHTLSECH